MRASASGLQHFDDVVVGVLGLCHHIVFVHHPFCGRVQGPLARHEQQLACFDRRAVGEFFIAGPTRVDALQHIARGDEVVLDQSLGMHQARHHQTCGARVDGPQMLFSNAPGPFVLGQALGREVIHGFDHIVKTQTQRSQHLPRLLKDIGSLRHDVSGTHDAPLGIDRLNGWQVNHPSRVARR